MVKTGKLQDRIKEVQKYFRGFEIKENLYIVKIVYPERWGAYPSKDDLIKTARSESLENMWFYYANVDEVDLNDIFDLIDDTVRTNESAELKVELMKQKMFELKELFQTEPLEKLQLLHFSFEIPKKKKNTNKKKKTEEVIIKEEIIEPVIENNDDVKEITEE